MVDMLGDIDNKAMQVIADDRPTIAKKIIEKAEKSIGVTGFEPST